MLEKQTASSRNCKCVTNKACPIIEKSNCAFQQITHFYITCINSNEGKKEEEGEKDEEEEEEEEKEEQQEEKEEEEEEEKEEQKEEEEEEEVEENHSK